MIFSIAVPSVQGLRESDYVNAEICYSTDLIISKFKVTSFLVTSYDKESAALVTSYISTEVFPKCQAFP